MAIIDISHLTKDFGNGKGVFDLSFSVNKGEIFGFLGPNGAGKSTTIRNLCGFIYPTSGKCLIKNLNCSTQGGEIQNFLGYIPGEIAFMNNMRGSDFIKFIAEHRKIKDMSLAKNLIDRFELDTSVKIKKMSKGMKQKLGIVAAFMHDPEVLILDEPTGGLDPLMQNIFIDLLMEEKAKGKTILMSSHIFEEIEKTCDKVAIIKDGKLVGCDLVENFKAQKTQKYAVSFKTTENLSNFLTENLSIQKTDNLTAIITIKNNLNSLISILSKYEITSLESVNQSLEDIFMHYYGGEKNAK